MIKELIIHKNNLITIPESYNAQQALEVLESNQLRLAPILDETDTLYRGNIYRYHLYQQLAHHPDQPLNELSITPFLKNSLHIARENDSIYDVFFAIRDLPHVAILNDQNAFVGVIDHRQLKHFFSQAWAMDQAKVALEIITLGAQGELNRLTRLINRYSDITSVMTLEATDFNTAARVFFLLPYDIDMMTVRQIERALNKRDYRTKVYEL